MTKRSIRPQSSTYETDTAEPASTSQSSELREEEIRQRAYHRYLQRGGGDGMDFDDWLEAERELRKSEV